MNLVAFGMFSCILLLLELTPTHQVPVDKRILTSIEKITKRCGDEADIMFLLDVSSSVGRRNFEKMKDFVHHFASNFNVDKRHVHVGAIRFSKDVQVEFHLTDYLEKKLLLHAIDELDYGRGGTTPTGSAIKIARENLFNRLAGHRPSSSDIIILITDGLSNRPHDTFTETEITKEKGIIFFSVGVGDAVNQEELETIASDLAFVFNVENYNALDTILEELSKKTCEVLRYSKENPVEYKARCIYESKFRSVAREFMQGARWHDGCMLQCECVDAVRNGIKCQERCPVWNIDIKQLPNNCKFVSEPGGCVCKELICS